MSHFSVPRNPYFNMFGIGGVGVNLDTGQAYVTRLSSTDLSGPGISSRVNFITAHGAQHELGLLYSS